MAASMPNATNVFLPSTEATNNLVVDFSRNPKKFPLNQYIQIVPVKLTVGRYIQMTIEVAGRVLNTNLSDRVWADNADAPSGVGNVESHEFKPYATTRYAFPFQLGELTVEQATWDILAAHARIHAQAAMTARTQLVMTLAQATGSYPTGHTSAVSSITGVTGKHDVSTTARKDIKRSLDHGADVIVQATLGAVEPSQLIFVCSPGYARKVAVCQEIVDHIKGSPDALKELTEGLGPNTQYGLPSRLYGYEVRVENTVKVTSRKGATRATSYIAADDKPFLCSRPGDLEGVDGSPSFSTFSLMSKEEMTVESKHDKDNRNHKGRVVEDFDVVMTAPIAGYLFTDAVSV